MNLYTIHICPFSLAALRSMKAWLLRYVDLTSRCSEMMTDVVGYVLARNCERPASETRAFLNPADGFLSPWLGNFADFIGRF